MPVAVCFQESVELDSGIVSVWKLRENGIEERGVVLEAGKGKFGRLVFFGVADRFEQLEQRVEPVTVDDLERVGLLKVEQERRRSEAVLPVG